MAGRQTLFLIDGSSYIYRAFFAIPYLSNSAGQPTNAVYGFTSMLLKIINDYHPAHLAIAYDTPAPTFRHEVYQEYKANRPRMPDNLIAQVPFIKEIVKGFNIKSLELEGFEADDIIATIARAEERRGMDVCIVSGDKDLLQLVSDHTTVIDTMRDKRFDPAGVLEHLGVKPERVVDFLGLVGDTSDNVPGVPGIGKKTAIKLIGEFDSIENLLRNVDKVDSRKVREHLIACSDKALLSRQLVTLDSAVPLNYQPDDLKAAPPDREKLTELFQQLLQLKDKLATAWAGKEARSQQGDFAELLQRIMADADSEALHSEAGYAESLAVLPAMIERLKAFDIGAMAIGKIRHGLKHLIFSVIAGQLPRKGETALRLITADGLLERISFIYYANIVNAELSDRWGDISYRLPATNSAGLTRRTPSASARALNAGVKPALA